MYTPGYTCRHAEAWIQWAELATILHANAAQGEAAVTQPLLPTWETAVKIPLEHIALHNRNKSLLNPTLTLHVEKF